MTESIVNFTVSQWLEKHPHTPIIVDEHVSLKTLAKRMLNESRRDAYVRHNGKIRGHIGFFKIMSYLFAHESPSRTHRHLFATVTDSAVDELMDPHFQYCKPDEKLADVLHRQLDSGTDDLLVFNDSNQVLGVVQLPQILRASLI